MAKEYDVIWDSGHGGKDPGAVKVKRYEKDYTLMISLYQHKRALELGFKSGLTRHLDKDLTEAERVGLAQQGTFCFSNHLNAGGGDRAEVIHSIYDNGRLANAVKDELLAVGQTSVKVYCRKGTAGDYYYMHRRTGSTVTNIVEYCFLDNEVDFAHFEANWQKYAEAVIKAFCQYAGRKYVAPVTPKPPASKPIENSGSMYRVVTGSFKDKANADKRVVELKSKGFESFVEVK